MSKRWWMSVLLSFCLLVGVSGTAYGYSSMVVLGDSLSDDGTTPVVDPFGIGRFTDGPIWVETVAASLGANLYGGAFGGATTGDDNPAAGLSYTGLQWQVANVVPAYLPAINPADTLFSVWAGANDFFQGRNPFTAATNIRVALDALWAVGARDILVPNLPNLGLTPAFYNDVNPAATQAQATDWSMAFNQALAMELAGFGATNPGVNIYAMDTFGIFNSLIQLGPNGEIADPAYWGSLFWTDHLHPSSIGHQEIADAALLMVPEPSVLMVLITGLSGLVLVGRRRRS